MDELESVGVDGADADQGSEPLSARQDGIGDGDDLGAGHLAAEQPDVGRAHQSGSDDPYTHCLISFIGPNP